METSQLLQISKAKRKRIFSLFLLFIAIITGMYVNEYQAAQLPAEETATTQTMPGETVNMVRSEQFASAKDALEALPVKGRAPKSGYARSQFGNGWQESGTCDTRNRILARDLTAITYQMNSCVVLSGNLEDPYTGKVIAFQRGSGTSALVQIDHVVALSDAWQKGAQLLTSQLREQLANDELNLLAVDGAANQNKGDGDAATWLPANKAIRCPYIARQISVKLKYSLWVTSAEKAAMSGVLGACPEEKLAR